MGASMDDNMSANSDEGRLISLGHKPELKRTYNFWSCMTFQNPYYGTKQGTDWTPS